LQQFKDDPAARFRVRLAIKKLKKLGQSNTLLGRGEYEVIIKASEDTVSCGFLSFGCEGPLQLPLFDPDFHLKGYRRVKVFANRYPWIGSKIELEHGNQILVLASGKVTTSSSSNNLPPSERLVMRIGESRSFFKFHSRKTGEGAYRNFSVQESGELQFTVRDWDTYPPPQNYYSDNTGSYLLDVFVFDSTQLDGFKKFLRALIQQNPEDTEFSAGAQDFLKGALQHPKQESEVVWAEPINGMKFVIVPGGSFLMGSPSSEEGRRDNENLHLVHVGKFHLMETELTQAQWKSIMGSNPSHFMGEERPVERVSLDDVQKFIKKLNSRTGEHFRLPTEAEWEYAVRAGTKTTRYWGEEIGRNKANCKGCGNHFDGNQTTKVKSFASNDFGLYDMLGNVSEWTCSMYQNRYSGSEKKCANQVAAENLDYSIRGGSWSSDLSRVRSAYRTFQFPTGSSASRGFRLARDN
ncbi:MAG TPA: formylglycine-generating enzyme family protein, partial [Gammaproteobacteria bacterium]|nr:formylglycine-generating enzyme family protein [Gammaproteobacteria bacterium]